MHLLTEPKAPARRKFYLTWTERPSKNIEFIGGCNGNLQGISKLVEGMDIDTVIERLDGIHCGMKETSCPDQLANALKKGQKSWQRKPEKHGHAAAPDLKIPDAGVSSVRYFCYAKKHSKLRNVPVLPWEPERMRKRFMHQQLRISWCDTHT